jgi:YaiO family outer membrane protein
MTFRPPLACRIMKLAPTVILLLLPLTAHAQRDSLARWALVASAGIEQLASDSQSDWVWNVIGVRRQLSRASVAIEGVTARRFDLWDRAGAADVYATLGRRTYVNVRAQFVPDAKVLPTSDIGAEAYHALGGPLEGSVGWRRMQFSTTTSNIASAGVAWTGVNTYLRTRWLGLVRDSGGPVSAFSFTARRFATDITEFVEGGLTMGREVVSVGPDQTYDVRSSTSAHLRAQRYLTRHLGFGATVSMADQERLPRRTGLTITALLRW